MSTRVMDEETPDARFITEESSTTLGGLRCSFDERERETDDVDGWCMETLPDWPLPKDLRIDFRVPVFGSAGTGGADIGGGGVGEEYCDIAGEGWRGGGGWIGYGDSWFHCIWCMEPFFLGASIAGPGADLGCSGNGDRESVRDDLFPEGCGPLGTGAELGTMTPPLGDARPELGSEGDADPGMEALFVRRQSFLMLFTLIIEFVLELGFEELFPSSDASESTEKRLVDGASREMLLSDLLCGTCCRSVEPFFILGECSSLGDGMSSSEGKRPNGSGDSGMTGESEPGLRKSDGATRGG